MRAIIKKNLGQIYLKKILESWVLIILFTAGATKIDWNKIIPIITPENINGKLFTAQIYKREKISAIIKLTIQFFKKFTLYFRKNEKKINKKWWLFNFMSYSWQILIMKGTVKFFNFSKGYGFITTEEGFDVFVHSSALNEGPSISDGDNVEFEVQEGERGKSATNVQKI